MAQRVEIVLEDDLDGSEAAETVVFALDGTSYEIDLNDKNAAALRDALSVYVGHARKVSPGRRAGARSGSSRSKSDAGEIRAWARQNGYEVSERGRVPRTVVEAFEAR
jgi:hypothetical protein